MHERKRKGRHIFGFGWIGMDENGEKSKIEWKKTTRTSARLQHYLRQLQKLRMAWLDRFYQFGTECLIKPHGLWGEIFITCGS